MRHAWNAHLQDLWGRPPGLRGSPWTRSSRISILCLILACTCRAQEGNAGPKAQWDPARLKALQQIIPLTTAVREDDHPAAAARDGQLWVTWVSYSETEGTTQILARHYQNNRWSDPIRVTEAPGDYNKPAIAIADDGAVWIAWPAQVSNNWDIYGRVFRNNAWTRQKPSAGPVTPVPISRRS
jgi:hypothetical protein